MTDTSRIQFNGRPLLFGWVTLYSHDTSDRVAFTQLRPKVIAATMRWSQVRCLPVLICRAGAKLCHSLPLADADGRALSLLSDNPIGLILMTLPDRCETEWSPLTIRRRCINCAVDSLITHARSTAVSSHDVCFSSIWQIPTNSSK